MTAIEISLSGDSSCSSSIRAMKLEGKQRHGMALYDEFAVPTNSPIDLYSMINMQNRRNEEEEAFQREHIIQIQDDVEDSFDDTYGYGCARWKEAGKRMVRDPFGVVSRFKNMVRENFSSRAMETMSPEEERRINSHRVTFVQH